jgi:nicotinamidase-related amidase
MSTSLPSTTGDPYTDPSFTAAALITIDTQRDVLDGGPFEVPGTSAALPNIRALAEAFRDARRPIVHVVRLYRRDGSNVDLCRREAVADGTRLLSVDSEGAQLAPELLRDADIRLDSELLLSGELQRLGEDEFVVYKPRWGAFFQTALEGHLRDRGVTTLVFARCNFPNCPRTSIYEASERDFRIVVAGDVVSGIYDRGERELRNISVPIMGTGEIVAEVANHATVS